MRRTVVPLVVAVALLAVPIGVEAQQRRKVHRVGYTTLSAESRSNVLVRVFERALQDLGYVVGRDVVVEYRHADRQYDRLPSIVRELVEAKVDAFVASTNPHIAAAKAVTSQIPIVMVLAADPVGSGFVKSLARPGGNITGLSGDATPETFAKGLALLVESVPGISRIALVWNPHFYRAGSPVRRYWEIVTTAALRLHVTLLSYEVHGSGDIEAAFNAMSQQRADAVFALPDPAVVFAHRASIADLAVRHRLASAFPFRDFVDAGGLMSYGTNLPDMYRRAAIYLDKIFKGAKPADLPVEQPTKFEFVVNLRTAHTLGLTIPQSVMLRVDEVIK